MAIPVKIVKLHPDAIIPSYARTDDAGADLYSLEYWRILPSQRFAIGTGIALEIPIGYEGQIRSRSGLAIKKGLVVLNAPGTIDSGYRGEIRVILANHGWDTVEINPGDRIAQLVIAPVARASFEEMGKLSTSDRGENGFGSTGVR